jgi:predicted dehydrogenase
VKVLFDGLGSIGQRHLRNLLQLKPDCQVAAVRRKRSVPVLSHTNQVLRGVDIAHYYNLMEYESLQVALKNKPDVVFVTNPTSLHISVAKKAVEAGAFVFIEKPLSSSWRGVQDLLHAENQTGSRRISVGYQFRFHPALKLVKRMLDQNRVGEIVSATMVNGEFMPGWHPYEDYRLSYAARSDLGGGALVTQIHDFDNALWFFGLPLQVCAVGGKLSSLEIDVEDSVQVLMSCGTDKRVFPVTVSLDYLQWPPRREFSIIGESGRIDCDLLQSNVTVSDRLTRKTKRYEFPNLERNHIFLDELRDFLSFVDGGEASCVDLPTAMMSLKVAISARQAMRSRKTVKIVWK